VKHSCHWNDDKILNNLCWNTVFTANTTSHTNFLTLDKNVQIEWVQVISNVTFVKGTA